MGRAGSLRELDRAFVAWSPEFTEAVRETSRRVRAMHERRPAFDPVRTARPTLPAATARRHAAYLELVPRRVWLDGDVDGLGVLLAEGAHVEVREPDGPHRRWLDGEARRAGVAASFSLTDEAPAPAGFDVAGLVAGPSGRLESALRSAFAAVAPGGAIVVSLRFPWESGVYDIVEQLGLRVLRYVREVDEVVLDGRLVLEGAGDLLVLERPATPVEVSAPRDAGPGLPIAPSISVEIHSLDPEAVGRRSLSELGETLRRRLGGPEAEMRCLEREGRQLLAWYGVDGTGFLAELVPSTRVLWMAFMPYDPALETRVLGIAAELFGAGSVRTRPRRTVRTPDLKLFVLDPGDEGDSRLRPVAEMIQKVEAAGDASGGGAEIDRGPRRLADGLVLVFARQGPQVVDLVHADGISMHPEHAGVLERMLTGRVPPALERLTSDLVDAGVLVPETGGADPVLRDALARLDGVFLDADRAGLSDRARLAHARLLDAHARRKRFLVDIGQCPTLPETALRRALAVGDAEDVGPKDVLCLGDDDMVGVALATLGHRVTVLDIDTNLLAMIERVATDHGLRIRLRDHDLRDPLEEEWLERFDVVLTDPVSSRASFELFLSRGLSMLRPGGTLYTAVFPPVIDLFREIAHDMRLEIEAWHARHNRYYSHRLKLHGYESDWVRTRRTAETRGTLPADAWGAALDLYDEDVHWRRPSRAAWIDLEETRHARALFLEIILDVMEGAIGFDVLDRFVIPGERWSAHGRIAAEGSVVLHADLRRKRLCYAVHPHSSRVSVLMEYLLRSAYVRATSTSSAAASSMTRRVEEP